MKLSEITSEHPRFKNMINLIESELSQSDIFVASWIEGSLAQGHGDRFSDLDIWIASANNIESLSDAMPMIEECLKSELDVSSKVELGFVARGNREDLRHYTYFTKNNQAIVEINVQKIERSSEIKLVQGVDDYCVIFDKTKNKNAVQLKPQARLPKPMVQYKSELTRLYCFQKFHIEKSLNRGLWLEALMYYFALLEAIIYFKRLKEITGKHEYGLKHIYRDLSKKFNDEIEYFYDVNRLNIENKLNELDSFIKDAKRV